MSDDEALMSITDAIQSTLAANGEVRMITRSVIIYESMDEQGNKSICMLPDDEMNGWDMCGFATYLDEIGRQSIREMIAYGATLEDGEDE